MNCDPTTQTIWCGNELTRIPAHIREAEIALPWDQLGMVAGVIAAVLVAWWMVRYMRRANGY